MKKIQQKGFTIVELLIVIVVIAILAAISIVAYNGIQNRARTSSAQTAASNAVKKAGIYQATESSFPTAPSALTGAATTKEYRLDGVTFASAALSVAPATPATVAFYLCGIRAAGTDTAPTTTAQIATTTGVRVNYWSWTDDNGNSNLTTGTVSGTVGTQNVGCVLVP